MKWITKPQGYTPLMETPTGRIKLLDLSYGAVLEDGGGQPMNGMTPVLYGNIRGWIKSEWLNEYVQNFDVDCVDVSDIQTPDSPVAQYITWKGVKQYNMCGEMAVCYLLQIKLSEFLKTWEIKQLSFYQRVFGQGKARGTGAGELVEMFQPYNIYADLITSKFYSPDLLNLYAYIAIVGVKINTSTGRLNGSGVGHWVVVTGNTPERTGYGMVEVYNPFPNKIETYSYAEFLASARTPYRILTGE